MTIHRDLPTEGEIE